MAISQVALDSENKWSLWSSFHLLLLHLGIIQVLGFPGGSVVKNPPASVGDAGDTGLSTGSGRVPGVGNGNPLQSSCLGNPLDSGAWRAIVHRVAKELNTT